MRTIKLPRKHAEDWFNRCDDGEMGEVLAITAQTITLKLTNAGLSDLISDARYYAEEMGRDNTGDIDYRPAARRCLAGIERAGVTYTINHFQVRIDT